MSGEGLRIGSNPPARVRRRRQGSAPRIVSGDLPRAAELAILVLPALLFSIPLFLHLRGDSSDFVHIGDLAVAVVLSAFALYSIARLPVDAGPSLWLLVCGPVAAVFAMDGAGRVDRGFGGGVFCGLLLATVASLFVVHGIASASPSRRGVWERVPGLAKVTAFVLALTLVYAPWYGDRGFTPEGGPLGYYALWNSPKNPGGFPPYWDSDRIAILWLGVLTIAGIVRLGRHLRTRHRSPDG